MVEVRPLAEGDRTGAADVLRAGFGDTRVARMGELVDAAVLPGFVASTDGGRVGLVTYALAGGACEVVTVNSLRSRAGVGMVLLDAVRTVAAAEGCGRLWLITTNHNVAALRLYQRFGMDLVALHRLAAGAARRLKPSIPMEVDGIRLEHELELELELGDPGS